MGRLIAIGLVSALSLAGISAQAMTLPAAPAGDSMITTVAGGCGPGMHRGPYGGCRPMFSCPRGWHSGPYGRHCFRNY